MLHGLIAGSSKQLCVCVCVYALLPHRQFQFSIPDAIVCIKWYISIHY